MNLHGVMPPVTTPFNGDVLDLDALRRNLVRLASTPLAGVVVLGSNGEAALLDEAESERLIAAARDAWPRDRPLISGVGRESTRATIAATRAAAREGASAVLVRTPSFFKSQMTGAALLGHYVAVADASPVPVLLYNFPALTGVNLVPDAVAELSRHPNIAGVKESGGDLSQIAELVRLTQDGFTVLVGSAATFYASLCVGVDGGILALACVAPEECCELYALATAGRHEEALALQHRLTPLAQLVTVKHGVPGLKAALDLAGHAGGSPRPPLVPAPPAAVDEIRRAWVALRGEAALAAR